MKALGSVLKIIRSCRNLISGMLLKKAGAPFLLAMLVVMRGNFQRAMRTIVAVGAAFPVIMVVTQALG